MYTEQDFAAALTALKDGCLVYRKGWNGKGLFVYLVPAASYPAQTGIAKQWFGEAAKVPYAAYLALKNGDGQVHTWVPSISDLLANDWNIVEADDEAEILRMKGTRPVTLGSIRRLAKKLRKDNPSYTTAESLDAAAHRAGFDKYSTAQRTLGDGNGTPKEA